MFPPSRWSREVRPAGTRMGEILLFLGAVSQVCGLVAKHVSRHPPAPARASIVSLHSCLRYMGGIYPAAICVGGLKLNIFTAPKGGQSPIEGLSSAAIATLIAMAASPPPHAAAPAAAPGCSFRYRLLPKGPRQAVGSARLRCTSRRWCCWLAPSGSGRQAARSSPRPVAPPPRPGRASSA